MDRRHFLKTTAAAAIGAPFVSTVARAEPWVKKGEKIKVGVLFSLTGDLAVIETDSTRVVQYAIDEINKNGGVAGMEVQPVIIDAKSDIKVYSEKISELILRDRVICTFGGYTSASRRAVAPIVIARDHLFYYPTCYEGRECTQNIINTGPLANQHSFDLIPFMVKNFGKKTYFVGSNYVWPKNQTRTPRFGSIVSAARFSVKITSRLADPSLLRSSTRYVKCKPDFIFSTVVGNSDIAFHKQFKQEGFKVDKMPIAALTTGEIETRAMGAEFGAGHFLSAPYFQVLDNPTNHKFVENYLKSPYGGNGVTHYNMEETYLSVYVWKYGFEKAVKEVGLENVTPRKIRDVSGGIRVEDDVSPEGLVWIDPDNFNIWLKPKIGQCQGDGQFKVVKAADTQVAPDPFAIYPDRGVCKADGLHKPDGTVVKGVL